MTNNPSGSGLAPDPRQISVPNADGPSSPSQTAKIIPFPPDGQDRKLLSGASIRIGGDPEGGQGGEGGEAAPLAPIAPTNRQFLETLFTDLPAGVVPLVTAKVGDPNQGAWIAHDAKEVEHICTADLNTYFNCASFLPLDDGTVAATNAQVAAYHALVLDDVGTKVDESRITLKPTWKIETSPGNYQVGFKLSQPLRNANDVKRLQDRIANAGLTDKGAKGMNRWARLPNGINGKTKYLRAGMAFACKLFEFNAEIAYTADELLDALAPEVPQAAPLVRATAIEKSTSGREEEDAVIYVPKPQSNACPPSAPMAQI